MKFTRSLTLTMVLILLFHGAVRADTLYRLQPIIKQGDPLGDTTVKAAVDFTIDALNDSGQLLFQNVRTATTKDLFQYADGRFTPIVLPAGPAPIGNWPKTVGFGSRVSMNQQGDVVFAPSNAVTGATLGTFLWNAQSQQVTAIASKGMPAVGDLTFTQTGFERPAINNRGEIAFLGEVKRSTGQVMGWGVFLRSPDGRLTPVVLPGQVLPDQRRVTIPYAVDLNDDGQVAFLDVTSGHLWPNNTAYVWKNGELALVASSGSEAPDGGKIYNIDSVWVNNKNGNVLVSAVLDKDSGPRSFYLWAGGKLTPVALPGQPMPGGGQFVRGFYRSVSTGNTLGQHAFLAEIKEDGRSRSAAYLMDADGKLSLILKSGTSTDLGPITVVGLGNSIQSGNSYGVALNNKGQVALTVKITGLPTMIALLTPTGP